jgi:hypothetical protein
MHDSLGILNKKQAIFKEIPIHVPIHNWRLQAQRYDVCKHETCMKRA